MEFAFYLVFGLCAVTAIVLGITVSVMEHLEETGSGNKGESDAER